MPTPILLGAGAVDNTDVASGSPSNFTSIIKASGATIKGDADRIWNGVVGTEVVIPAGGTNTVGRYETPGSTNASIRARGPIWGPGATSSEDLSVVTLRTYDGTTKAVGLRIHWSTSDSLTMTGLTGGTITLATGLNPANCYEVSIVATQATTTTGSYTIKVYDASGTQVGSTVTGTAFNFGTVPFHAIDLGCPGTVSNAHVLGFGPWQFDLGSTVELSRYSPPAAPAATVRPVSVAANPGAWTVFGGSTDAAAATNDSSGTTGIQSPTSPGTPADIDLTLADALILGGGGTLYLEGLQLVGSGGTYTAYLFKAGGSSPVKTWTLTPTTTATDTGLTLSGTDATAIGTTLADWAGLKVRLRAA